VLLCCCSPSDGHCQIFDLTLTHVPLTSLLAEEDAQAADRDNAAANAAAADEAGNVLDSDDIDENVENINQMYANRFDLVLIIFSFIAFVASR